MVDEAKLHQFVDQMLNDLGGAISIGLVQMGDALGLYRILHEQGPMTTQELAAAAGIRRFLLHLPPGFHRIRHYGLLASSARKASLARARQLLALVPPPDDELPEEPLDARSPCPCCGGHMIIIETFARCSQPRAPPHRPSPAGRRPS